MGGEAVGGVLVVGGMADEEGVADDDGGQLAGPSTVGGQRRVHLGKDGGRPVRPQQVPGSSLPPPDTQNYFLN